MGRTLTIGRLPDRFGILETPLERMPKPILYPFAWDELMCRKVGEGRMPIVHIWRHPSAFVLGLRDRRLPLAEQAMNRMRGEGIEVGVRNSGGAAVPLDGGVVNLSIVLPNPGRMIDFHDDFRLMAGLIASGLEPWRAKASAGEIEGAYCPGAYDLSIGGRKFCGIAQRRQTKAYTVSAFVVVTGSGESRGERVRRFYEEASGGLTGGYPMVSPEKMASLEQAAGIPSAEAYIAAVKDVLLRLGGLPVEPDHPLLTGEEEASMMDQLRHRYDKG